MTERISGKTVLKLVNVLFTGELARRLAGTGVTANCLHPGAVATNIWSHAPWYTRPLVAVAKAFMISAEKGADFPSAIAQDEAIAKRLWEHSAALVSLPT